jgi:hypothetical protein
MVAPAPGLMVVLGILPWPGLLHGGGVAVGGLGLWVGRGKLVEVTITFPFPLPGHFPRS